jgi:hypothetical protein
MKCQWNVPQEILNWVPQRCNTFDSWAWSMAFLVSNFTFIKVTLQCPWKGRIKQINKILIGQSIKTPFSLSNKHPAERLLTIYLNQKVVKRSHYQFYWQNQYVVCLMPWVKPIPQQFCVLYHCHYHHTNFQLDLNITR